MNVEQYNIFRITTCQVRSNVNEIIFEPGQVLQAIMDLGSCWLARPVGSAATPRMLPKAECRELNEAERVKTLIIRNYTGPLFNGGVEFGWREVEGGPVEWFTSTSNDEAEIQRQVQEYRQVCGFEFEVEDWRQAGEGD